MLGLSGLHPGIDCLIGIEGISVTEVSFVTMFPKSSSELFAPFEPLLMTNFNVRSLREQSVIEIVLR